MKRTGKKALSLLLTLCMVVSLFAGLTFTASAEASNTLISISSDGATGPAGGGWNWDEGTKTLTLSGVDIDAAGANESAITIADLGAPVTIVLEGANQLQATRNGILSSSELTIKGSGTLVVTGASTKNGIYMAANKNLTIQSGYHDMTGSSTGIYVDRGTGKLTISGGYVVSTTTTSYANAIECNAYEQTGGYVKATSAKVGLMSGATSISGGYLEAKGTTGISCAPTFTNSGGVVKTEGTTYAGIMVSNTSGAATSFTGGVTIAKGAGGGGVGTCAITCNDNSNELNHITTANGEELYSNVADTLDTTPVAGTTSQSTAFSSDLTSVIVAKAAYNSQQTLTSLDGVYIKTSSGTAWKPSGAATIPENTGSYVESGNSTAVGISGQEKDLTVNGTLVCSGMWGGIISKSLTVADSGTVFANGDVGAAITNTGTDTYKIDCSGTVIGVGNGNGGIVANGGEMSVTGGYACGIDLESDGYGIQATKLTATGGCITGVALTHGVRIGAYAITSFAPSTSSSDISVTDTAALTATGTAAYYGPEVTAPAGKVVFGSANPGVLASATYNAADKNYGSEVVFFFKESTGPSISVGAQSAGTITAGTGGSATYTVTPAGFDTTPTSYAIEWVTTDHAGVSGSVNGTTATITATNAAAAGAYKFKVTTGTGVDKVSSAEASFVVSPATGAAVSGTAITGYVGEAVSKDVTVTLTGMEFKELFSNGDVSDWFDGLPADWTANLKGAVTAGATTATVTIAAAADKVTAPATGTITGKTDGISKQIYIKDETTGTLTLTGSVAYTITAAPDSWVGDVRFNYADASAFGDGWTWNGTTKTLTLSGVNVTTDLKDTSVNIAGSATIVLEGANKITGVSNNTKYGIDCRNDLTIKGSGTLEIDVSYNSGDAIYGNTTGTLTVESGYIKAIASNEYNGEGVYCKSVTVNGGYLYAKGGSSGISASAQDWETTAVNYTQTGGYVKSVAVRELNTKYGLIVNGKMSVTGGYLEVSGYTGIKTGDFTNAGGVVKAIGNGSNANGIEAVTATFTGGVTIASGVSKAIDSNIKGSGGEKLYNNTSASLNTTEDVELSESVATSVHTSVVIAKAIEAPEAVSNVITLDGVYLYSADGAALDTEHDEAYYDVAVTGGSYLENTGNAPIITAAMFSQTNALSVSGTLVCKGASNSSLVSAGTVEVGSDATLYVSNNAYAIFTNTSVENSGNLIAESTNAAGVNTRGELRVTGGYLCGVSAATNNNVGCIEADSLTATGGYITGVGGYHCIKVTTSASITGAAVITASTSGHGYSGPEITSGTEKATVKGATAQYTALAATTFDTNTYNGVDSTAAQVLLIKGTTAPPPPPAPAADVFYVIVDGRSESIGELETDGGDKLVKVDSDKLGEKLKAAKDGSDVIVNVPAATGKASAELVVKDVNDMAEKGMELKVRSGGVEYAIPADAVDTEALIKELGAADPALVSFGVSFGEVPADSVILGKGTLVAMPIEFTVTASYNGKAVEVEVFEKYTSRTVEVSAADAANITTAVVLEGDAQRHAPTNVYQKNGQWYARISTLTNSVYALIDYDAGFADAKGLWYEAVVSEMASREIIDGRDADTFDGEADITRAEFAALVVRALGLPSDGDASMFKDVAKGAWYYGAVGKAYEYKLLEGRGDGVFDPLAKITRQEAMQMVYNAAKLAEIKLLSGINPGQYTDLDKVSGWAEDAVNFNLLNGLVKGDGGLIRPTDNISRAESATILLRLLQKSELVDARAEA